MKKKKIKEIDYELIKLDDFKSILNKGILLVFSVFLLALCYNLFLLPNNLTVGGVSGIAIVVQEICGFDSTLFIYISTIFLIITSFIFLGKKTTLNTILGSIMYPIMITLTAPIANYLLPYFEFNDIYLIAFMSAILLGFANGLVFRYNFSTGGTDIITLICTKYFKIPEGKAMFASNIIVIILGGYVFGLYLMLINLLILYINSLVLDKIKFDLSDSKIFYVFTHKEDKVITMILDGFNTGYTIMPTQGGYSHKEGSVIMAVLPNREYFSFKNAIVHTDPKAFFIVCDCYESFGGYKKKNIPFL